VGYMSLEKATSIFGSYKGGTIRELKRKYRSLAMKMHPDTGGDAVAFNNLQDAYNVLKMHVKDPVNVDDRSGALFVEGRPISEFGHGYPISENARTCERCDGNGFVAFYRSMPVEKRCSGCDGTGAFSYPCRKCDGSGRYIRGGKDRGECNLCKGGGRFYPENKKAVMSFFFERIVYIPGTTRRAHVCRACGGNGVRLFYEKVASYMECPDCHGIGEIKMWNPVIPRGFMSGMKG
jgi:DnaJ-class molecular chaperone